LGSEKKSYFIFFSLTSLGFLVESPKFIKFRPNKSAADGLVDLGGLGGPRQKDQGRHPENVPFQASELIFIREKTRDETNS